MFSAATVGSVIGRYSSLLRGKNEKSNEIVKSQMWIVFISPVVMAEYFNLGTIVKILFAFAYIARNKNKSQDLSKMSVAN